MPDAPVQRGEKKVGGTQPAGRLAETIRTDRIEKAIDRLIVAEGKYEANPTKENKAQVDRAATQVNIEYENEIGRAFVPVPSTDFLHLRA